MKLFDSALLNLINWIMHGMSVHSFVSDCHCFPALINWIVYVCTWVGLNLNFEFESAHHLLIILNFDYPK